MRRLASAFGSVNHIRRDRPLTRDELARTVPSVFGEGGHHSRSDRYTWIPTITVLDKLTEEGFQPFFACQTRVRDQSRREFTKHMLRLRREGDIRTRGQEAAEIILLNSHDGSSSYQMLPGMFREVCHNGMVCGSAFCDIRIPHKGDVVGRVIEGAWEVLDVFDRVDESRDAMKRIPLTDEEQFLFARAALSYRYDENHAPVTEKQLLQARRYEDQGNDLWLTFQRVQENSLKGGLPGRTASGKRTRTRSVNGIDGDLKLNRALWMIAEEFKKMKS